MKATNKRTLYYQDYQGPYGPYREEEEMISDYKKWLEDISDSNEKDERSEDEVSQAAYDWMCSWSEEDWRDFKANLPELSKDMNCVLTGRIGRWDGVHDGGKVSPLWSLITTATNNMDYIDIYFEKGVVHIETRHHDGRCYYSIVPLSVKGETYWQNNYYNERRKLVEHLTSVKGYTRKFKLSELGL